jgi:hypothetical protein
MTECVIYSTQAELLSIIQTNFMFQSIKRGEVTLRTWHSTIDKISKHRMRELLILNGQIKNEKHIHSRWKHLHYTVSSKLLTVVS